MINLLFLVFLVFIALAFGHLLRRFVRGMHATISEAMLGKAVHVETPIGFLHLKPLEKLDPDLASMLVYPGAAPAQSQPTEYEADAQFLGREFHVRLAAYSTLTPADVVWEFYRRELPDWQEKRRRGYGRSIVHETADGKRKIRVYSHNGSTMIETGIYLKHKAEAAAAGKSSGTRFGILR